MTSEPPKGCKGEPSTSSEGFFEGTIEFTGERKYVQIDAARVKGRMSVNRRWRCPQRALQVRALRLRRLLVFSSESHPEGKRESATLAASGSHCRCYFLATAHRDGNGRGPTNFYGLKIENRNRMEITRMTSVRAGAPTFVFDHSAGTARVHPPSPFRGRGAFERRPHGPNLWRSTIRVPLLGSNPLSVRGNSFRVKLSNGLPEDNHW
jgi:hypothetical protein